MQTGSAISLIDQPNTTRPGLVVTTGPWRPAILAPFVHAVSAVRDFFLHGADEALTSRVAQNPREEEPMKISAGNAPAKTPLPAAAATPSTVRLEAAVRKAANAKAKARDAKAALKKAKKGFRLARKAAKAARKEVEALQATITRVEEKAAAAARRARATRRAPKTDPARAAADATPGPPVATKPVRKTRRAAPSTHPDADVVCVEPLATPSDPREVPISPA